MSEINIKALAKAYASGRNGDFDFKKFVEVLPPQSIADLASRIHERNSNALSSNDKKILVPYLIHHGYIQHARQYYRALPPSDQRDITVPLEISESTLWRKGWDSKSATRSVVSAMSSTVALFVYMGLLYFAITYWRGIVHFFYWIWRGLFHVETWILVGASIAAPLILLGLGHLYMLAKRAEGRQIDHSAEWVFVDGGGHFRDATISETHDQSSMYLIHRIYKVLGLVAGLSVAPVALVLGVFERLQTSSTIGLMLVGALSIVLLMADRARRLVKNPHNRCRVRCPRFHL